ncbi:YihY/virulence factor BrkB family protein [Flammeovirga pectinis]|uniref:YihY/virulence factor BrkB family protein n=1 Tax=Flammeovirga pectinis TaxID=2494373 RepID=A0A3S9P1T1_9BACT|nr:YihY/virulence factor BrkB family protein [Flammeovirga pectinis]AZQ62153.1 YihY/virulence factor BrkB family protein [Flammeovirga pectinis]
MAWKEFNLDHAYIYGASLAYYTIVSLPAALNLLFTWLSAFFDENKIKEDMVEELELIAGDVVAQQLNTMINSLTALKIDNTVSTLISIGTLIFSSTLSFHTLKLALNKFWKVPPKTQKIKKIVIDRLVAFGMMIALGVIFILLVAVDSMISFASTFIQDWLPTTYIDLISIVRFFSTLIISFFLFSGIYKFIPDVKIKSKDAYVGGLVTTLLFQLGQYGIRYYLVHFHSAASWGAGSPIIIVMAWTFYSVQVLFYGAEFTYAYSQEHGNGIETEK